MLTIYFRLYWILEFVVFYFLARRGYIRKVSVQLVPKYFSRDCSTDSISCNEQKKRKKKRLKQDSKSRKEDQNVFVVANPIGSSSLICRTAIIPLSRRYRYTVALLLLRCHTDIAPLSHHYCTAVAPPLLLCCCADVAPLSLHCLSAAFAPVVATQLHRYRTAIAPLSRRCWTAVAPAQRGYKQFKIEMLLLYCNSTVAYAVDRKVHKVVASRGIIRVTVTIGDCQARVSSSSEGCSTSQKTVKVETY